VVRTTLGAEVETTVTVSGSESVDYLTATQGGTVSANGREDVNIRAPSGSVYELLALVAVIPGIGGTSGQSHELRIRSESEGIKVLTAGSNGPDFIIINDQIVQNATGTQNPSTEIAQQNAVQGLRADSSNGFQLRYVNNTSNDQTGNRIYRLWLREITVSE